LPRQLTRSRFKVITYPRTDSRYLPEGYIPTVKSTLSRIENRTRAPFSTKIGSNRPNGFLTTRRFGSLRHHPTGTRRMDSMKCSKKSTTMIVRRFISGFFRRRNLK